MIIERNNFILDNEISYIEAIIEEYIIDLYKNKRKEKYKSDIPKFLKKKEKNRYLSIKNLSMFGSIVFINFNNYEFIVNIHTEKDIAYYYNLIEIAKRYIFNVKFSKKLNKLLPLVIKDLISKHLNNKISGNFLGGYLFYTKPFDEVIVKNLTMFETINSLCYDVYYKGNKLKSQRLELNNISSFAAIEILSNYSKGRIKSVLNPVKEYEALEDMYHKRKF